MKTPFLMKLAKFVGVLAAITVIMLMVCAMLAIIALTTKFLVWLFI